MARGWIVYTQDDGTNVSIKATTVTATANGQTLSKFPPVGQTWAWNYRDMRHITGVSADGLKRARMTITDETALDGAIGVKTWTNSLGTTFTCTGTFGERKDMRDAG